MSVDRCRECGRSIAPGDELCGSCQGDISVFGREIISRLESREEDRRTTLHRLSEPGEREWRWYITDTALAEYMVITGERDRDRAKEALRLLCAAARIDRQTIRGAQYVVSGDVRGRRSRLALSVSFSFRAEGALPQLVRVRHRASGGRAK